MSDYYKIVDIKSFSRDSGSLFFVEESKDFTFDFKRIFYIKDMIGDRANHAHYKCKQFLICLDGSFDVELFYKSEHKIITLDNPNKGLLVNPLTWVKIFNFEKNPICLVLASHLYDESDYINDFAKFQSIHNEK
jgi:hypothetical protein